jgi:hypothetical protein
VKTTAELSAAMTNVDGYPELERLVAARVAATVGLPLFETKVDPNTLWGAYLDLLPADRRQHYNCNACRRFVQKYGRLVSIDPGTGEQRSAVFHTPDEFPKLFRQSANVMAFLASKARVTGFYLQDSHEWGVRESNGWTHLHGTRGFRGSQLYKANQLAATVREDYVLLKASLDQYPPAVAAEALRVLQSDALTRSEKGQGAVEWFVTLHANLMKAAGRYRDNLLWLAAATAPAGYCHAKNGIVGTLFDDIVAGLPFEEVSRRWAAKLHPLNYQRPKAAPTSGQIDRAEEIFRKLGAESALRRRFATLDDVLAKLWTPQPELVSAAPSVPGAGAFSVLRPAVVVKPFVLPPKAVTWEKFARDVLPFARTLEYRTLHGNGPFYGLVTAADPAAPPILQWDGLTGHPRNPVSWYFYHGGSLARGWNLPPGEWVKVTAVFYAPPTWQELSQFRHFGEIAFLALDGAVDGRAETHPSLSLFPESLRAEFREARASIEAFNKTRAIEGWESGTANGAAFSKGSNYPLTVRVDGTDTYLIDRWE